MAEARVHVQFESFDQQTHAARLGMWIFLVSEILLFSGLFVLYASYRVEHTDAFREAVRHANVWLGSGMTLVLLTSSLTVALGVHAVRHAAERAGLGWILLTLALGVAFLGLKATEYTQHVREGALPGVHYRAEGLPEAGGNAFFTLYWMMTGLHALHVIGGLLALGICALLLQRRRIDRHYPTPLELSGLYWHLVDVIWLFLWPLFYLMR